jgi:hypothetical protein
MNEPEEQIVRVIHEYAEPATIKGTATLADLYWQDRVAVLLLCAISGYLLFKPEWDKWKRNRVLATKGNVVPIRGGTK